MEEVGRVKEIWRYPVKGMGGERLDVGKLGTNGVEGDRVWAVRDVEREEIQSCKFRPKLLLCIAETEDESGDVSITFPDGDRIFGSDPLVNEKLTELLGYRSELVRLDENLGRSFFRRYKGGERAWLAELEDTFTREEGEAGPDFTDFPKEAQDFVTVPGSFFLVSPFHVITTASLDCLRGKQAEADWDVRRFRPNVVVETRDEGLVEQGWIGSELTMGDARFECSGTAIRCGAVTRRQQGFQEDKTMLRTIVREGDQNLGVYGGVLEAGLMRVGDEVRLAGR